MYHFLVIISEHHLDVRARVLIAHPTAGTGSSRQVGDAAAADRWRLVRETVRGRHVREAVAGRSWRQ